MSTTNLTPVQRRLLAKLPATATGGALTMPERGQLRILERRGLIRYVGQSGYWVRVTEAEAAAAHRAADPHCTCNDCIAHHAENGR